MTAACAQGAPGSPRGIPLLAGGEQRQRGARLHGVGPAHARASICRRPAFMGGGDQV
jgi:hypothetical protein